MNTQCHSNNDQLELEFQGLNHKKIIGKFDGGYVTSDGGALLLREIEARTGIISELAGCFEDFRNPNMIEHTVKELLHREFTVLPWDMRILTTMTDCELIQCLPLP